MTLEIFFEKFDLFADAPDGVAKMREMVRHLAVTGKLVPQDPNDESVAELLERCVVERRKLQRANCAEVRLVSDADALGYDIPDSWRWQMLGDLLIYGPTNGFSPKAVDYETPVRSLTLSATTSGQFKGEHSKFITTDVPADSDLWLRDGDILVQRGNTIEYVGVAAIYRGEPHCFVYPDLMMKLRVSSSFCVGYVHIAMSHCASRDFLRARASGTSGSMPKINQSTLKCLPLPIPPLAEQKRIVAKVDELMALCDRLEAQQQERETLHAALARASLARFADAPIPANLNRLFHPSYSIAPVGLRKSILTLAVRGKLVPQGPDDEPAEELLAKVERDKAEMIRTGIARPFKHLLPVLEDETPNELPASWKWVRTETICEAIVDCPHSTPVFIPSGIACLDTNGFKEGQLIPHKIRYVSEETYGDRIRRLVPRAGDIVFAREGSVGASVIVPENLRCCLGQRVMLFRLMSDISPRFFSMALSEASSLERLLTLHKGIGAKHVNVADMRNAVLPLPPLAEQRRIIAKVDQLMALVDELETQLAASRSTAANLLSALVAELTRAS